MGAIGGRWPSIGEMLSIWFNIGIEFSLGHPLHRARDLDLDDQGRRDGRCLV